MYFFSSEREINMEKLLAMNDPFVGNIAGILLSVMMLTGLFRRSRLPGRHPVHIMLLVTLIATYCTTELAMSLLEGIPGRAVTAALYLLCSLLFLQNMLLELGWVLVISDHVGFTMRTRGKVLLLLPLLAGILLLIANCFYPLVFRFENNTYERAPFLSYYVIAALFYYGHAVMVYVLAKRQGGVLKYFPVWLCLLPSLVGLVLEAVLGSSFIGICNAISSSSLLNSFQNEQIFKDDLTGLYNRTYLEKIKEKLGKEKNHFISGIMMDMNNFKSINDTFGHTEGDKALTIAAGIIKAGVGAKGDVIRYAGDEFIVLINTWKEDEIQAVMQSIETGFARFNANCSKPYQLSASMGCAVFNAGTQSVNEFINSIDKNMYEQKKEYYKSVCRHNPIQ